MKHLYHRVKICILFVLAIVSQTFVWAQGCTPPAMTSPNTLTICSGQGVNLPLTANQPNVTFTWVATSNANILGESTTTQNSGTITDILSCVGPTSSVTYTVTPNLPNCPGVPQTVTVNVVTAPLITSPGQLTLCSGSSVGLTITTNSPGSTISWVATSNPNVTGESTTTQIGSTITDVLVNTTTVPQTVTYTITATSLSGCTVNSILFVTVNPIPNVTSPNTATICSGSSLNFALMSSIPGSVYTWVAAPNNDVTGESTTLQTTSTINDLLINLTTVPQIVTYTVTTSFNGCVGAPQTVTVTVNPTPVLWSVVSGSLCGDTTICSNAPVSLILGSTVVGTSFFWIAADNLNVSGESLTLQNSSIITDVLVNQSSTNQIVVYSVTPTANGCVGPTQTVSVCVQPILSMTSPNSVNVTSGSSVNLPLTATIPNTSFNWYANSNPNVTGESLSAQNSSTITDVLTNTTQVNQTVTYFVIPTSTTNGCSGAIQTVTVTVTSGGTAPSMTSTSSVNICSGSAVNLPFTATLPNTTYSWVATNNNNVSGESTSNQTTATLNDILINNSTVAQTVIYTVTPTSNGITGSAQTVSVTVNPSPTFTGSTNYQVCSGAPLGISLTSNTPNAIITWVATPNSNVTGETTTPQTSNFINDLLTSFSFQTVVYTVTINSNGCSSNQIIVVTVAPPPMILGPNTANICSGTAVNLPLTSDQAGVFFTWFGFDNTSVTGESTAPQNTSTITDVLVNATSISQIVMYQVNAINTAGCISMTSLISVTVNPSPVITNSSGTPCDVSICSGNSVNLPITSTIIGSTYSILATDNVAVTGETTSLQQAQGILDILTNTSSVDQTVSYTVTPSFNGCTGPSEIINVCVTPIPVVSNTSNQTLCNGDTLNLTLQSATPGTTFVWNALSNAQVTGESVTPQNTSIITDILSHGEAIEQMVVYEVTPTYNNCSGTLSFIDVYVQPNYSGTLDTTSAGSVVINGVTYDSTGTFTQVLTSGNGCDSLLTIQFTLGLDDLEPSVFEVYPNPSNGVFYIMHQLAAGTPYAFIDPTGRVLFEGKLESGKTQIDTGNIASGTYYVRVYNKTIQIRINK